MAGRGVDDRRAAARARVGRTLRFRLLIGLFVLALPGIASPFAHLSGRRMAYALAGEAVFALAVVAGVFAMRAGGTAKQGFVWVGCAAGLVVAGYGCVALGLT